MKHKKCRQDGGDDTDGDGGSENGSGSGGLKLILKVGAGGGASGGSSGKVEKHKKKKKKKDRKKEHKEKKDRKHKHKHKRRLLDVADEDASPGAGGDEGDRPASVDGDETGGDEMQSETSSPVPTTIPIKVKRVVSTTNNLARFLEYLLKLLLKKDTNGFFANPVNDQFAPGYSSIIKQPMDFSTMRSKLQVTHPNHYTTLAVFRSEFELMCTNAMTYNTQDTIYYKSAKKLLNYGKKILSPEKIRGLRNHLPFIRTIPEAEFGFNVNDDPEKKPEDIIGAASDSDDDTDVSKVIEDIREVVRRPPGRFEAIPDDMTAQEILDHARDAAKKAAEKLATKKPGSKMGFLRQKPDGTTSLNVLTGEPGVVPGTEKDRPVSLGVLLGKVKQGTGSIPGFREDRRNICKGVYPVYYGAYNSHGPTYDSTFANLTKEETELVYNTYSDTVGVQYAESILNFSRNCDYATFIVDHLLDILTGNEHRKTNAYIEERKKLRREDELLDDTAQVIESVVESGNASSSSVDFESLKTLNDDGIDMSFLDSLKVAYGSNEEVAKVKEDVVMEEEESAAEAEEGEENNMKNEIERTSELIQQLDKVQHERLSSNPPSHLASIQKPEEKEQELAQKIRENLVAMAGKVQPRFVASSMGVRKVLGASNLPLRLPTKSSGEVPMEIDDAPTPTKAT